MEKGEASNVSYEEFEPFCKWKKLDDSDVHVLEVHLPGIHQINLRSLLYAHYILSDLKLKTALVKQNSRKKN